MDHINELYQLAVLASFRPRPDELARALALQVLRDYRVAYADICAIDSLGQCESVGSFGPVPGFPDLSGHHALTLRPMTSGKAITVSAAELGPLQSRSAPHPAEHMLLMPLQARGMLVGAALIGTDVHPQPEAYQEFWATLSLGCGMILSTGIRQASPFRGPAPVVTSRQRQILELVAQGLTNQQIGNRLGYSESTIGHDLVAAYERLGVRNREDAVRSLGLADAEAMSS